MNHIAAKTPLNHLERLHSPRTFDRADCLRMITIHGSSNPDHIAENFDVFDFELTGQEMNEIRNLDRQERYKNW